MGGSSAWAYLRMVSRAIPGSLAMAGTHGSVYVMTLARTTAGINKAEDAGRKDAQIGFADALQRVFPTTVVSHLAFRGWIRQETLWDPKFGNI